MMEESYNIKILNCIFEDLYQKLDDASYQEQLDEVYKLVKEFKNDIDKKFEILDLHYGGKSYYFDQQDEDDDIEAVYIDWSDPTR